MVHQLWCDRVVGYRFESIGFLQIESDRGLCLGYGSICRACDHNYIDVKAFVIMGMVFEGVGSAWCG